MEIRLITGDKCVIPEGGEVFVAPYFVRHFRLCDNFNEETIKEYCDWKGANYLPVKITAELSEELPEGGKLMLCCRYMDRELYPENNRAEFTNIIPGTDYSIKVIDKNGKTLCARTFVTADRAPRTVYIPGLNNTRDIGGIVTADGKKRVRYNLVYRGTGLSKLTEPGGETMVKDLGVKTELDLTGGGEVCELSGKLFNVELHSIRWYNTIFDHPEDLPALKDTMLLFTKKENFPFYMHCSLGRDRTGSVAFILKAICGCPDADINREHFYSWFSTIGDTENVGLGPHFGNINALWDCMLKVVSPEKSIKENTEAFLKGIGITDSDLDKIRENLLEEIPTSGV